MGIRTMEIATAVNNAIRASGVVIQLEESTFLVYLNTVEEPLVVFARVNYFFSKSYQYVTSYKGFIFLTLTKQPIQFSKKTEIIEAENMWLPF